MSALKSKMIRATIWGPAPRVVNQLDEMMTEGWHVKHMSAYAVGQVECLAFHVEKEIWE